MRDALIFTIVLLFGIYFLSFDVSGALMNGNVTFVEVGKIVQEEEERSFTVVDESAEETATTVPILMYHYVRDVNINYDQLGWKLSVSPEEFERQLKYLKDNGYTAIHLSDLVDGKVPERAVVLSFDDGTSDFYTNAMPLLKKYNMTASNAIITGMIGDGNHMTFEEIQDCIDAGIEITAHTDTHPNLSYITFDQAKDQIVRSREILETTFNIDVNAFVYPSGAYTDRIVGFLEEQGFEIALTTVPALADLEEDNMLLLPRQRIDNRVSFDSFVKKLSGN